MKKYRLKKDIPTAKAGTLINEDDDLFFYFPKDSIENFDEWFEEIQEPKWTDADMDDFAQWFHLSQYHSIQMDEALEHWKSNRK